MSSWQGRSSFTPTQRRHILARHPVCIACHINPSTIADHEPNRATLVHMGVPDPDDERYGQGMCSPCHDLKTQAERLAGIDAQPRARRRPETHPGLL